MTHSSFRSRPASAAQLDIEACRRGNRQALGELFRREAPALERLISRLLGPGPETEDLLQCTLMAAVSAFPRYRGEATVRTWLARIAVRVVYAHLRRPAHAVRRNLTLIDGAAEPASTAAGPAERAESRQLLERLYAHLQQVGPRKRIAFVLHVLEGRPIQEVAALTGATETATKSRIFFARRALLERIRRDPELKELLLGRAAEPCIAADERDP